MPGTRSIEHLEQNVAAYEISKTLTGAEMAELEAAVPAHEVQAPLVHPSNARSPLRQKQHFLLQPSCSCPGRREQAQPSPWPERTMAH